jgi:hypothetical protein
MSPYIALPSAVLACAIIVAVALWPSIWLTRSPRAFKLRRVGTVSVLLWWVLVALPWVVVLIVLHFMHDQHISVSVHGIPQLIGVIAEALAIFVALVSLPLAVLVLTVVWLLDRRAAPIPTTQTQHEP